MEFANLDGDLSRGRSVAGNGRPALFAVFPGFPLTSRCTLLTTDVHAADAAGAISHQICLP